MSRVIVKIGSLRIYRLVKFIDVSSFVVTCCLVWYTAGLIVYSCLYNSDYQRITDALKEEVLNDGVESNKSVLSFSTKFYFFHVTNPDEVKIGRKPLLRERGPYFYQEQHTKVIEYIGNGFVKYWPKIHYIFRPEISHGSESDQITLPNIPFISISKMIWDLSKNLSTISNLDKLLTSQGEDMFLTASVKDWLFNGISIAKYFNIPLDEIKILKDRIPEQFLDENFGFLYNMNGRNDLWVVSTEKHDMGRVLKWNEKTILDIWGSGNENCNEILGTDGTFFQLFVNQSSDVYFYSPETCRSFRLNFQKLNEHANLDYPVLEFGFNSTIWTHKDNPAEIYCYCKNTKEHCTKPGLLPIDKCLGGMPLFISAPHFKDAHPDFVNEVDGLSPNNREADYNSYFYFEEGGFGRFFGKTIRLQLNINLQAFPSTTTFSNIQNTVVPLLWFDQRETVAKGSKQNILKMSPLLSVHPFPYYLFTFLLFSVVMAGLWFVVNSVIGILLTRYYCKVKKNQQCT